MNKSVTISIANCLLIGLFVVQPAYSQQDADDAEFSFEHLSRLEAQKQTESLDKTQEKVTKNATNEQVAANVDVVHSVSKAETVEIEPVEGTRSFNMWRSVGALLIILGGLFVVTKWVQGRLPNRIGGLNNNSRMKVVERLTVDHRRQLILVAVDDREMVIALSPTQIDSIAQWQKTDDTPTEEAEVAE